jgi:hypothetical protein
VKENTVVFGTLTIFGNGGYLFSYDYQSGDVENWEVIGSDLNHLPLAPVGRPAQAQAQAYGVERGQQVAEVTSAVAGAVVTRILDNEGDVHWELDQMRGLKYPNDERANAGPGPVRDIRVEVEGPHASTVFGLDEIYADFRVEAQVDGRAVGNIRITPTHTNDAVGEGLTVKATIMDDARLYTAPGATASFAALKVQFQYRFDNPVWADIVGNSEVTLYGNGDHAIHYETTQA